MSLGLLLTLACCPETSVTSGVRAPIDPMWGIWPSVELDNRAAHVVLALPLLTFCF